MLSATVTTYVDEAVAQLRRIDLMRWPGPLPDSMLDRDIRASNDWKGWMPVVSEVTDDALDQLEAEIGLAYPPLYRDLLKYRHFVELTERGVRFERHLPGEWQERLRRAYFRGWPRAKILDQGLIPFGSECFMDAGPMCFDTRLRSPNGDCPVVFWDHDAIGTDHEIQMVFSSAQKMFECLTIAARTASTSSATTRTTIRLSSQRRGFTCSLSFPRIRSGRAVQPGGTGQVGVY